MPESPRGPRHPRATEVWPEGDGFDRPEDLFRGLVEEASRVEAVGRAWLELPEGAGGHVEEVLRQAVRSLRSRFDSTLLKAMPCRDAPVYVAMEAAYAATRALHEAVVEGWAEDRQSVLASLDRVSRSFEDLRAAIAPLTTPATSPEARPPADMTPPASTDPDGGIEQVGRGSAQTRTDSPAVPLDLVTLDQAAATVHKSKRTLERYKTRGVLPAPAVEGGGGRADLYDWAVMRIWLTERFGIQLPERYPRPRPG